MSPKISVIIITIRIGGLDWQLKLLSRQTFKDFEVIVVDGLYKDREESIKKLASNLGLNLIYIQETFPYRTGHNRPYNENCAIAKSNGEYLVFIDDYQIFPSNFLEEHYKILKFGLCGMTRRDYILYMGTIDYSEIELPKTTQVGYQIDGYLKDLFIYSETVFSPKGWRLNIPYFWWQPSVGSAPAWAVKQLQGFNELYCGGDQREDSDLAYRMSFLGLRFAYNPNVLVMHIHHGDSIYYRPDEAIIPMRPNPYRTEKYKCNFKRPPNEGIAWDIEGYKLCECKYCKEVGPFDSMQMLKNTMKRSEKRTIESLIPPKEIIFPDGSRYQCTRFS